MVIRKSDRVSTVLRADESLIDVFIALSPAFERLRDPAMRKVMSRLVTIEQAARMAGVDADQLVSRLNGGGAGARRSNPGSVGAAGEDRTESPGEGAARPAGLERIPPDARVEVDVREDLRNGHEPFSRIMAARGQVPPGGGLRVRATFEPVPLYAVMEKQGLAHHTEQLGPEDWSVWFYPAGQERDGGQESGTDHPVVPKAGPGKGGASQESRTAGNVDEGDSVVEDGPATWGVHVRKNAD
jgi:hypothetical protein